jgi:hypothetical protein
MRCPLEVTVRRTDCPQKVTTSPYEEIRKLSRTSSSYKEVILDYLFLVTTRYLRVIKLANSWLSNSSQHMLTTYVVNVS